MFHALSNMLLCSTYSTVMFYKDKFSVNMFHVFRIMIIAMVLNTTMQTMERITQTARCVLAISCQANIYLLCSLTDSLLMEQACDHHHEHHHHDHHHGQDGDSCAICDHDHGHAHGDHGHSHDHGHGSSETTAAQRFGIRSFVYSRRRPFHPQRLKEMVLKWLPVTQNKAIDGEAPAIGDSPIKTVLRSKGFMWMSNSHATAYYWSHAGQHFEIRDEGDW